MRIRVTMRADLFEERKQQHIERGYRIEDERLIPVSRTGPQGATTPGRIEEASVYFPLFRSSTRVPSH